MGAGPTRDGVQARPNAMHASSRATSSVHSALVLDWTTIQIPLDPDQGEIVKFTNVWYEQAAGERRGKGRRERGGGGMFLPGCAGTDGQLGSHTPYTYMLGSSSYQVLSPLRYTHTNVSSHRIVDTIPIQTKVPILEPEHRRSQYSHRPVSPSLVC